MPIRQATGTRCIDGASRRDESAASGLVLRALDLVGAAAGLVFLAVPIALIAVAVKLESPGPALYRCRRVGRYGRDFDVLKFRKMRNGASGPALTLDGDRRLTRLGALLVKYKLDELPQLWNVLRGQMSLVGPRPEDRVFVDLHRRAYADEILRVRPGITGLTQLAFGYCEAQLLGAVDPGSVAAHYTLQLLPQKVELDRQYVAERSVRLNLAILWWTLVATVARYDVAVDRKTYRLSRRRRPAREWAERASASPPPSAPSRAA
ncbi:MAG TPA: sugar transferase [Gaiellaceae bacterium]|nr:sugar transferase [Gaiellaceae bacterium]